MPQVYIPAQMRDLSQGVEQLEVEARNVRQVIAALDAQFPGMAERLVQDGRLRPGLAVSIDGELTNQGLLARLSPDSEVHFLPAIGGG
jgi:molybdopterin synthase sulfur carrier subunit